jgi:dTMP kinase
VVIVDVPVEIGFKRARSRGDLDRIEMQETAFFERIRQYYLSLADKDPKRYMLLDGSKTIESVLSEFWDKIYEYLK